MNSTDSGALVPIVLVVLPLLAVTFAILCAVSFGIKSASADWRNACEKHGMTISDDKVYECRLKPTVVGK
ncbi:MAG: hypothetical protein EBT89_08055 [Opitutaceae bacterium]|nr:hypothetical protein [Opitutaceae bacterium]